jgi:DNA-binding transcriptional MocR family regulator
VASSARGLVRRPGKTKPAGGLFIWAELPSSIDTTVLLKEALQENVAFVPGDAFHADGTGHNTMRLNFTNTTEKQITEGIDRLRRVIARAQQRAGQPVSV